ncbi:MAG: restriction endonuclease [Candidatus Kapabacteria bacterium]|nr:restriction endonuclease [Candidatus Kapabacteria bacterium]
MAIPVLFEITLPLLQHLSDAKIHSVGDVIDSLSSHFALTQDECEQRLPSGTQGVFENRVRWARVDLKMAGLIDAPARGMLQITDRGKQVVQEAPQKIDRRFLMQFPEYSTARKRSIPTESVQIASGEKVGIEAIQSPDELFDRAYQEIRSSLKVTIKERILHLSPSRFERLVVELLVKMGYGGALPDAGSMTKLSGDEGIDGIIKEDKLGLDMIYLQAKRWKDATVGRPEIQKFVGALAGQKAQKGVFITTSAFSKEAREYATNLQQKVVLIDGEQLAELMIEYNLGVSIAQTYHIKRVDNDYFDENID